MRLYAVKFEGVSYVLADSPEHARRALPYMGKHGVTHILATTPVVSADALPDAHLVLAPDGGAPGQTVQHYASAARQEAAQELARLRESQRVLQLRAAEVRSEADALAKLFDLEEG